jgi:hypothetical protein
MQTFSVLALILLSMFAYSAGAVALSKNFTEPKPQLADLCIMLILWSGGILTRSTLGWNKWLLVLGWMVLAYLTGGLANLFKNRHAGQSGPASEKPADSAKGAGRLWLQWKSFARKAGAFQSRLILSYFYFLCVTPFGLAVKIFGDPLRLRQKEKSSYWLPKKDTAGDVEQARRQF